MIVSFTLTVEKRSDHDVIEYIYRQYYPLMRYAAGRVLPQNSQEAEDAVQDAMIRIIKNVGIIDVTDKKKFKNLCCIIARNCALNRLAKKDGRTVPLSEIPEDAADEGPPPDQSAINNDVFEAVVRAIGSLPDTYRDACFLKYVHGYKEKEVVGLLGVPARTASTRIHRGKMLLREALRKEGYHE